MYLLYAHVMVSFYMTQVFLIYDWVDCECCFLVCFHYIALLCANVVIYLAWFNTLHCHDASDFLQDICASCYIRHALIVYMVGLVNTFRCILGHEMLQLLVDVSWYINQVQGKAWPRQDMTKSIQGKKWCNLFMKKNDDEISWNHARV